MCIDVSADVGEIAEDVEAVKENGEVASGDAFGDAGIPDKLVGVHARVAVASAAVHGEVCGQLHVPWQFDLCAGAILERQGIGGNEVRASAGGCLVGEPRVGR